MGGSLLHVKNREFLFDHTSKDHTSYDSPRRSIYLPVIRNHLFDMFQLFDYVEESVLTSDRATTTVAPQALFTLNAELPQQAARAFAQRLWRDHADSGERLRYGYLLAFGRPPTAAEQERDLRFLATLRDRMAAADGDSNGIERHAWELLCHTWLATNEFIYVR
jgi:hypothetical protein